MQTILIILFSFLILIFSIFPLRGQNSKEEEIKKVLPTEKEIHSSAIMLLSRAQIAERLKYLDKLVNEEAKKPPLPFAMCYSPRMTNMEPADYFCMPCGAKTRHIQETIDNLNSCRTVLKNISAIKAVLDERFYCASCNKDKNISGLFLEITYPDSPEKIRTRVTLQELQALSDFFKGAEPINSGMPGMRLTDYAKRVHEILGIPRE